MLMIMTEFDTSKKQVFKKPANTGNFDDFRMGYSVVIPLKALLILRSLDR